MAYQCLRKQWSHTAARLLEKGLNNILCVKRLKVEEFLHAFKYVKNMVKFVKFKHLCVSYRNFLTVTKK